MALKFRCTGCGNEITTQFLKPGEQVKCKSCGVLLVVPTDADSVSDIEVPKKPEITLKQQSTKNTTDKLLKKYPALRIISQIYRVLAVLSGIVAFFGMIVGFSMFQDYGGNVAGGAVFIGSIVLGSIAVVTLLAFSEGINVFVDIEHNTSEQIKLLKEMIQKNIINGVYPTKLAE